MATSVYLRGAHGSFFGTLLTFATRPDTLAYNNRIESADMNDEYAFIAAEISNWPTKSQLVNIFQSDGYAVIDGNYSVGLADFDHFAFRGLGGDLDVACITGDHESTEELVAFARRVSQTLANSGLRHRFEVYSEKDELAAYLHHDWPKDW